MSNWQRSIKLQTASEEIFNNNDKTIRVESSALTIRFPFGGIVWNCPTAVQIDEEGQEQRYPIIDITRISILALLGINLLLFISSAILATRSRKSNTKE